MNPEFDYKDFDFDRGKTELIFLRMVPDHFGYSLKVRIRHNIDEDNFMRSAGGHWNTTDKSRIMRLSNRSEPLWIYYKSYDTKLNN